MNTFITIVEFLATIGGLYGVVTEISDKSTAQTFVLIIIGTLGAAGLALQIKSVGWRVACCIGAVILGSLLVFNSWTKGGPHALWEEIACRLETDACIAARIARISQNFDGLGQRVFNQQFTEQEIKPHRRFCVNETANSASQVALFELSVPAGRKEKIEFNYLLRSGNRWEPRAHSLLKSADTIEKNAFEGYLALSDRLTRSGMSIGPYPATMLVRVCGVPSNEADSSNNPAGAFWVSLDVYDIRLSKTPVR